ncbi:MAG: LysR family transcriptional regulator [Clostridiales bacterium]|nr:LysR family transcriptional regulator [Clostridiales bacterium]
MINFSIRQLEVFVAVTETNSFSRAANDLALAQSTVSAHIKGLEDALGVHLFVRNAKKQIMPTQHSKELYSYAKAIVEQCRILNDEVSSSAARQELLIAASTDSFEHLLPGLMADYAKLHPASRFVLLNGDSTFVHEQLHNQNARIGFCGTALNRKELEYRVVCRDKLVMIAPNNRRYQKLQQRGLYGCDLLDEPMIERSRSSGTKKEFDNYLKKTGMPERKLNIVAMINQADAVKRSVISGLGVAVVSQMAAKKYEINKDLLVFDLDAEGAYRDIYLVYPKDLVFSKAERDFVGFAVHNLKQKQTI